MRAWAITDTGKVRTNNQDRYICDPERGLFVVCDGMGGHRGGEVAAQLAVDTIDEVLNSDKIKSYDEEVNLMPLLARALARANEVIWQEAQNNTELSEMGTTATVALIRGNHLFAANIGDSPLFLIRQGSVRQLTQDHTLAKQMVEDGIIAANDPTCQRLSHILTRALGVDPLVNIDFLEMNLQNNDILLLATDGLTAMVASGEIAGFFKEESDPHQALRGLMDMALFRGGVDNITMVAVKLEGE